MLKSAYAASYDNFKCGEIFCISPPAVFNVTCVVCEQNVPFDEFVTHFQIQHLTLVEKTISLEDLAIGTQTKLEDDVDLDLDTDIKAEDPVDDPIKQDSIGKIADIDSKNIHNNEDFDEDKCLLQLINESKQKRGSKTKRTVSRKPTGRTAKKTRRTKTKQDAENDTKVEKLEDNLDSNENLHNDNGKAILNEQRDNDEDTDDCKDYDIDYKDDKEEEEDDDEDKEDDDEDYWPDEKEEGDDDKNTKSDNAKEELPFKCTVCSRSYISKQTLRKHHYNTHNPNKPPRKRKPKPIHKCDICNEVFRSAIVLSAHKYKHTGIFCDICGKPFRQVGSMLTHKIRHTGVKEHKCKECPKEFFTAKELKSHMICHTGMQVVCEICGKRCRDSAVLSYHMRRHTGERPAKCEVCGKAFFTTYDLNVHAVSHSNERPFPCDVCGSRFQRKKALRIHKRIHSKDGGNHVCKICDKNFTTSGGLNSHMRSHDTATIDKSNTDLQTSVFIPTVFIGNPYLNVDSQEASGASMSSTTTEINVANAEEVQLLAAYIV